MKKPLDGAPAVKFFAARVRVELYRRAKASALARGITFGELITESLERTLPLRVTFGGEGARDRDRARETA